MEVERIKELQSLIDRLQDFEVDYEDDNFESLIEDFEKGELTEDDLESATSDLESITVDFPDEFDHIDYSIDEFCEYMKEAVESCNCPISTS